MNNITKLELDLLLLYYTFSDDEGKVDMPAVQQWAKTKFGIFIPPKQFMLTQEHVDVLMDNEIIPDTRSIIKKVKMKIAKRVVNKNKPAKD
jgi:hypothetical protein